MRKAGPVTQKEIPFPKGAQIVSATDLKSRITWCNKDFVDISGYTEEELIGAPHNILRHPDMPQAAFKMLWDTVESGRPWIGIVKNRTKNGDHYWVSAYVMPLKENGKIVGYESVRTEPSRESISRAEFVYKRINQGKPALPFLSRMSNKIKGFMDLIFVSATSSLLTCALLVFLPWVYAAFLATITIGFIGLPVLLYMKNKEHQSARKVTSDSLAQFIYTGDSSLSGHFKFSIYVLKQHLHTVLERLEQLAGLVSITAKQSSNQMSEFASISKDQKTKTEEVALSTEELKNATHNIAQSSIDAAESTRTSTKEVKSSNALLNQGISQINHLVSTVEEANQEITELSKNSKEIQSVLNIISEIAEQTNLLALNAAIEAARAGDQGRGFAVVADEVRTLASRTQESTQSIEKIINLLSNTTNKAVKSMHHGTEVAEKAKSQIQDVSEALNRVLDLVDHINQQSEVIATDTELQSESSARINQNTEQMAELGFEALNLAEKSLEESEKLTALAENQKTLIKRFRD